MKRIFDFAFLFVSASLLFGCSSGAEISDTNKAPKRQTQPAPENTASSSGDPHSGNTAPTYANANTNSAAESQLATGRNKKLDAMRKGANDPSAPKLDVEAILKQSTRPAPENSEFSVALTSVLLERRTFLKHPVLARVEKLTDGERKAVRVQTTDGRVIELPGDAIPALSTVPSSAILKLIKLELPAPRQSDSKPNAPTKN